MHPWAWRYRLRCNNVCYRKSCAITHPSITSRASCRASARAPAARCDHAIWHVRIADAKRKLLQRGLSALSCGAGWAHDHRDCRGSHNRGHVPPAASSDVNRSDERRRRCRVPGGGDSGLQCAVRRAGELRSRSAVRENTRLVVQETGGTNRCLDRRKVAGDARAGPAGRVGRDEREY